MQRLSFIFIFFINIILSNDDNYVLVVSFDGFRHDYMKQVSTPNFDDIEKNGVVSEGLVPVFPSLTFPNHYSMATGAYSGKHNIIGNSFYDKIYGEKYDFHDKNTVRDPKFYKSEPIWVTAERQGLKTASYYWVGTEAPIKGYYPSIFKYYDSSISFSSRIDSVVSWFELTEEKRPRLAMLYFSEPDHTGHMDGASHRNVFNKVSEMDALLGYLMEELKKLEVFSKLNIFLLSDHGMVDVNDKHLIILDDYIEDIENYNIQGRGAYVQIDKKNHQELNMKKLQKEISQIPYCKFWKNNDMPERFHYDNVSVGKYLILADEGWFITMDSEMQKKGLSVSGMHGYDPILSSMHGIFYAYGPKIKSGVKISKFENIHVYPLLCRLLGIDEYDNEIDGPDGDLKVLEKILINVNE